MEEIISMPTSFDFNPMMMREIIMDHYKNPRHKSDCPQPEAYLQKHSASVNCIDDIDLFLKVEEGKIADALWQGTACTISTASTDILCDLLMGKTFEEAEAIIAEYTKMITGEQDYDGELLDEALAFMNTFHQPSRIHCATIGWDAARELLKKERDA